MKYQPDDTVQFQDRKGRTITGVVVDGRLKRCRRRPQYYEYKVAVIAGAGDRPIFYHCPESLLQKVKAAPKKKREKAKEQQAEIEGNIQKRKVDSVVQGRTSTVASKVSTRARRSTFTGRRASP